MHIKPKDLRVNLPIVLGFDPIENDNAELFAAHINTIIHGKVKLKYEYLGELCGKFMIIFYLQRNAEYQELRDEFMSMIDKEIMDRVPDVQKTQEDSF
ncbi:MAG: hypothetical protein WCT07_04195 [Candidatus Paceibacterota bacterium]